jgi:predicted DNA-binding antitoxin AbrB/MazE fold protein
MESIFEAIYEDGVLKPLEPIKLLDHQRVKITIHPLVIENPDQELESWHQVYAGLSDKEISEIETIAIDRSHFMFQEI